MMITINTAVIIWAAVCMIFWTQATTEGKWQIMLSLYKADLTKNLICNNLESSVCICE